MRRPHLFADTSGIFAAGYRQDRNFEAAQQILSRVAEARLLVVTTNYIVVETHALFVARGGREAGVRFLRSTERSTFHVVRATEDDEAAARAIIYRYDDKDFSLTDAISFAVMERLYIPRAFTFDSDFAQYGFAVAER